MIKILAIGNSFSQDATTYLHNIAKANHIETKVVNLYIGGCSLETHWRNMQNNEAAYEYELNGNSTGRLVSIQDALMEDVWDYVTFQQVSNDSGLYETYFPYLVELQNYVTLYAPTAKQWLHQTWAYEVDSNHPAFTNYQLNQLKMFRAITITYHMISEELLLPVIPCGEVIQALRQEPPFDYSKGGKSLCRDGFHLDYIYGRYAAAATWYELLLKKSILDNTFFLTEETCEVDQSKLRLIKDTVHRICTARIDISTKAEV